VNNLESKLSYEKLVMVVGDIPRVVFAHIILGLLLVFALSDEFSPQSLWVWFAINMLIIILRVIHSQLFKKYATIKDYQLHYRIFLAGLILSAIVWASTSILFFPQSGELKLFLLICIAGLASGAISSNSQIYVYLVSFSTILLTPFIMVFFLEASKISYFIAIALTSYILLVLVVAKKNNRSTDAALRMGYKNEDLVVELNEAVLEAKEASEAKSTFLSTMSHEIRTPLNAILGYISILQKKEEDETKRNHLDIIENSSHLLLGVINNILDFNKISTNNLELEMHSCDIQKELHHSVELFLPICDDKGIKLNWEIDTTIPKFISTDILRLNQIITNLISNAIKFTPIDKKITFSAKYKYNRIFFFIIDEGIGIDESKQALIFESFKQADDSTTRKYGGTGLGLSISSELVKLFDSELEVESIVGEGSTFSFSIPVVVTEGVDESEEYKSKTFNSETILVAEDNKTNQMLIKILLEEMNINADIVGDGKEAVKQYSEVYPLVLMDINMPVMNGENAMKHIKQLYPAAKIVALTANALVEDKNCYMEMGFDGYLSKPIDTKELNQLLDKMLSLKTEGN
jgi:signal transduction histidine kinase/CheY-like chemotaxis protein